MEDFLYQKNLYLHLEGNNPSGMLEDKWKVVHRKALRVVRLTLDQSVAFNRG